MKPCDIALDFLKLVSEGKIDEAYDRYVDFSGRHHNMYTPAGFEALRAGMNDAEAMFPHKELTVRQVLADGAMVMTYSHLVMNPGDAGMAVMHLFRVENGKIVELWDCGQAIAGDSPNEDGLF